MIYGAASISRAECRLNGVYDFSYGLPPNSQLLMASMTSLPDDMTLNLQLTVKVKTRLGLEVIDLKSKDKYPSPPIDSEVHFLKMEGVLAKANLKESIFNFRTISKNMTPNP